MTPKSNPFPDPLQERLPALMRAAIAEARRADQPFGCVLADFQTGDLKVAAANSSARDPTAHAEINALRELANQGLDPGRVVLISTAEPCPMCGAASWWAGVRGVVFGTSIADLIRFGWRQLDLPLEDLLARARPPRPLLVVGGYLAAEADALYRSGPRGEARGD
jgi:tRNA(Arg) A34 adenosine deaminase TadA